MTGIAAEFPGVPHRYCDNHFLRDLAKPVLEADSHAKVQMRKKVRGLRTIEQAVLKRQKAETRDEPRGQTIRKPPCTATAGRRTRLLPRPIRPAPWCSTIARRCVGFSTTIREGRCILPACGWPRRWTRSASRSNGTWTRKKGVRGEATRPPGRLHRPGLDEVQERARGDPRIRRGHRGGGRDPRTRDARTCAERQEKFEALIDRFEATEDPIRQQHGHGDDQLPGRPFRRRGGSLKRSRTISIWSVGFACPRVTSGGSTVIATRGFGSSRRDRRWCMPWTHTPRIPSRSPWTTCCRIGRPESRRAKREALNRRKIMRKARSKKKRPLLLADLERRYRESPKS